MTHAPPPADMQLQRSSRSPEETCALIGEWLAGEVGAPRVEIEVVGGVDANGMSSDTLVLDARWEEGGAARGGRFVTRAAPAAGDVPVFPAYALHHQRDVIRTVGEITDVPVPSVPYSEMTGTAVVAPFFWMEPVDGVVPPDVLPYTFGDNWFADAPPEQQRRLQDATVEVVARLHQIPEPTQTFGFLADGLAGRPGSAEQHLDR